MSWLKLPFNASLHSARVGRVTPLRIVIAACSVLAAASADRAMAADWPLRGSLEPSYVRWDGWQFGLLAGYSNMTIPSNTTNGPVFGGFLGYNVQWDQLVVGFDLAYKYPSVLDSSTALSTFKLVDYATLRGRAGYAFGQFLPYAVLGIAVGRFNYADLDLVSGTFIGKDNAFNAGFVAGLGVDWAVTPSIFLRAEWEYIGFATINGITPHTNYRSSWRRCALLGAPFFYRPPSPTGFTAHSQTLTAAGKSPISASGTPLPNEGRLSGRIDT